MEAPRWQRSVFGGNAPPCVCGTAHQRRGVKERGRDARAYSKCKENPLKVFKQENEWYYPCFKEITLEGKITVAEVWRMDCRKLRREARGPVRLSEVLTRKRKVTWTNAGPGVRKIILELSWRISRTLRRKEK